MSAFHPRSQVQQKPRPNPRRAPTHATSAVVVGAQSTSRSSRTQTQTQTVTTQVTRAMHRPNESTRKKLVFQWVQDVSGSMSGKRIESSLEGFDHMFENVCQPTDLMGVVTFNHDLNTLHLPMSIKKLDASRDKASIRAAVGGRTRMYDALGSCMRGLKDMSRDERYAAVVEDAVYQLLLITDGEDNSSTQFTRDTLTELVAHPGIPNFHLVVVAVCMSDQEKQALRGLCAPLHATLLDVENISELQHTLREVGEVLLQRLVITTTTVTQQSTSGSQVMAATKPTQVPRITQYPRQKPVAKPKQRSVAMSGNVCQHYLAGRCKFGNDCRNAHPHLV